MERSSEIRLPPIGLEGVVTCYALRPDGTKRDVRRFKNLITDAGMDYLGTGDLTTCTQWMGVGTDATAPAVGDVALGAPAAIGGVMRHNTAHTNDATTTLSADVYAGYRRTRISAVAVANVTYYEFGFFSAAAAGTMFNRQLFGGGGFSLLIGEQLVIDVEFRAYMPVGDVAGVVAISGVNYNYIIRPQRTGDAAIWNPSSIYSGHDSVDDARCNNSQALVARAAALGGTVASGVAQAAYVNGTFYRDVTFTWGTATFVTPIGLLSWWQLRMQMRLGKVSDDSMVGKTNLNVFSITIRHTWARH